MSKTRTIPLNLYMALAYFGLGWLSISLTIHPAYGAILWLPAGLAVAAILIWGRRAVPGLFVGAIASDTWQYAQDATSYVDFWCTG